MSFFQLASGAHKPRIVLERCRYFQETGGCRKGLLVFAQGHSDSLRPEIPRARIEAIDGKRVTLERLAERRREKLRKILSVYGGPIELLAPEEALATMLYLNDRWALDGRDPNSYTGILWVLGRFDRAWGPERPVFGKVRYMSSRNTRRKVRVGGYIERWTS